MEAYTQLEALFQKVYHLQHLLGLADWDAAVCMPPKGAKARGAAVGELQKIIHDMLTSESVQGLLREATTVADTLSEVEQANLREMKRACHNESVLPADFVVRKAQLLAEAQVLWAACKEANDFPRFLPCFQQLVESAREEGRYRAAETGVSPYEALLNLWEPGLTVAQLDTIYDDIKSWLPGLLQRVLQNRADTADSLIPLQTPIPLDKQKALCQHFMTLLHYDFDAGRLDVSAHPSFYVSKEDNRVTTHYTVATYEKSVFAAIHETGHSKYETGCGPREKLGQPVCMARSGGVHESQSLFCEKMIGRSGAFAEFMTPLLKEYLGDQPAFTVENVRRMNQVVKPGYIRILADEVCYPLHVILRYEIERALVEGKLEAADVPRVWNEKMKEYLGLETLGNDKMGCLQDIHWACGMFGTFPAYSIGFLYCAQLMATIKKELGEETVDKCLRTGTLGPLQEKLEEKVWSKGCLYEMKDLFVKGTGEPLTTRYFREHLERRYLRNED